MIIIIKYKISKNNINGENDTIFKYNTNKNHDDKNN